MKKLLALCMTAVLILSLAACSGELEETGENTPVSVAAKTEENVTTDEKKTIELIAGEQGEYGTLIIFNKGTEFEEEIIAYHIPAGEYTVTNVGKHMDQFSIYSDEIHKTDDEWEEPAESVFVKVIDVGATEDFTIEDGQYIKIVEPGKFRIEQK